MHSKTRFNTAAIQITQDTFQNVIGVSQTCFVSSNTYICRTYVKMYHKCCPVRVVSKNTFICRKKIKRLTSSEKPCQLTEDFTLTVRFQYFKNSIISFRNKFLVVKWDFQLPYHAARSLIRLEIYASNLYVCDVSKQDSNCAEFSALTRKSIIIWY